MQNVIAFPFIHRTAYLERTYENLLRMQRRGDPRVEAKFDAEVAKIAAYLDALGYPEDRIEKEVLDFTEAVWCQGVKCLGPRIEDRIRRYHGGR